MNKEELMKKFVLSRFGIGGTQKYNDFVLVLTKEEAFEHFKDIEQLEKALEILINKQVHTHFIKTSHSLDQYNALVARSPFDQLVEEEYELLKQVFESVGGSDE